jgi:Spy/CpxP family protein refolding chaperone
MMTTLSPRARRARLLGALVIGAVFVAGLSAGTAWTRTRENRIHVNVRLTTELPPELRRLDLTPAQEDSLKRVLIAGQRQIRRVLGEFQPQLRAVLDSIDTALGAVLTPEQRAKFVAGRRLIGRDEVQIDTVKR